MANSIRNYDEALINYFSSIQIDDGIELRNPQVVLSIPSFQGSKLQVSESWTPIFPIITITRVGLTHHQSTEIIKARKLRPYVNKINFDNKTFSQAEVMPYIINYKVDMWSLTMEQGLNITEDIIFKIVNEPYIEAHFSINNVNMFLPGYIQNYNFSDGTSYETIGDEDNRIIKHSITLDLFSYLIKANKSTKSVLHNIQKYYSAGVLDKIVKI